MSCPKEKLLDEIDSKYTNSLGRILSKGIPRSLVSDIHSLTHFLSENASLGERLFCLRNGIEKQPVCSCGAPVRFNDKQYRRYCSKVCASKRTRDKARETSIERFGVSNAMQNADVRARAANTCLERYGAENYSQSNVHAERVSQKRKQRYDVTGNTLEVSVLDIDDDHIKDVVFPHANKRITFQCDHCYNKETIPSETYKYRSKNFGTPCKKCGEIANRSKYKNIIEQWLLGNSVNYVRNDRIILEGKELDFYLPDHNLAIEVNGLYWHSDHIIADPKYHLAKTEACEEKNIQLIHLWEHWLKSNSSGVINLINAKIGHNKRIGARLCKIKEIDHDQCKTFLEQNHIQGYTQYYKNAALIYDDEIVAVMTIGKSRFNKKYDYELLRFCNKNLTTVVGGASKLLTYLRKKYELSSIVSYANRDISTGNMYRKLGFTMSHFSEPGYFYTRGGKVFNRQEFQKHKLSKLLDNYHEDLSEIENMRMNGFYRIWNTGNYVFVKEQI